MKKNSNYQGELQIISYYDYSDIYLIYDENFLGFGQPFSFLYQFCFKEILNFTDLSGEILRLCDEYRDKGVVGIDIAGNEGSQGGEGK